MSSSVSGTASRRGNFAHPRLAWSAATVRCRARVLPRLTPVASERRSPGRRRRPLLQKPRDRCVPLSTRRPREGRVGDVVDQSVLEPELLVALDPRHSLALDEVAFLERAEERAQVAARSRRSRQRASPEDCPDHGGVDEHGALRGRQRVEPRGDDLADARRQPSPLRLFSAMRAASSSMNSGLPSAVSAICSARVVASRRGRGARVASSRLAASPSGSSGSAVYAGSPPPQPGRSPRSSGRASARSSTGTSRTRAASVSSRSSRLGSAQWMSSKRSSVGPRSASDSTSTRAEKKSVSRSALCRRHRGRGASRGAVRAPPPPRSGERGDRFVRVSRTPRAASSLSKMPRELLDLLRRTRRTGSLSP